MKTRISLTAEQRQRAHELRAEGYSWDKIGTALGVTGYTVHAEMDPEWHAKKLARERGEYKETTKLVAGIHYGMQYGVDRNPKYDPARDGGPVWESAGAALLGDPPIGRRALDLQPRR